MSNSGHRSGADEIEINGIFGGIDPTDGSYTSLVEADSQAKALQLAYAEYEAISAEEMDSIHERAGLVHDKKWGFGPGIRLEDLRQAGWGVIFAEDENEEIIKAIRPLILHRAKQNKIRPITLTYQGESVAAFLEKYKVKQGVGQVDKVPYYLLIVGSPAKIPFIFQYQLQSEYAVGRLDFEDASGYAAYVSQLIDYEKSQTAPNRRQAVFWAPENVDLEGKPDRTSQLSAQYLAQTLHDRLTSGVERCLWRGSTAGREASKDNLIASLSEPQSPLLLFSASHGLAFRKPHPLQLKMQGGLLTQDARLGTSVGSKASFLGSDVASHLNVRGMVHYAFACFSAGTPAHDDFFYKNSDLAPEISDVPFVAELPRQLLANGALAFIGHVDRAWSYSFLGEWMSKIEDGSNPLLGFERTLATLLNGFPVGHALRDQHDRALQLSNSLLERIHRLRATGTGSKASLALEWINRNDARSYIVIGDPAACLKIEAQSEAASEGRIFETGSKPNPQEPPLENGPEEDMSHPIEEADDFIAIPDLAKNSYLDSTAFQKVGSKRKDQSRAAIDPMIYDAWKKHIISGFDQNSLVFNQVLDAFMRPYWMTVSMYRLMFGVGILGFVLAAILGVWKGVEFALIFGGISSISFLSYFVSRPLHSLEQNIIFITWLGVIYNTYWNRVMQANDTTRIQEDLSAISKETLKELDRLVRRHSLAAKDRPDLPSSSEDSK
jgi:hypothetical protein